jgi:hypothetical protein
MERISIGNGSPIAVTLGLSLRNSFNATRGARM